MRPVADTPYTNIVAMPRPLSADREREFQELFALVDFWAKHVNKTATHSQKSMADVCADIVQQHGRSKALEGLRMAANDIIEDLGDIRPEEVASLDESMLASGLVTLSELRRRYASSYRRITKRGQIRNDTEYYLIKNIVVDLAKSVSDPERDELQRLLDAYDSAVVRDMSAPAGMSALEALPARPMAPRRAALAHCGIGALSWATWREKSCD